MRNHARPQRTLAADTRGVVALEFAIVAMVLFIMLIGATELTQFIRAKQKLSHATETLANMIGEQSNLTNAMLVDLCGGASSTMAPFAPAGFGAAIANVTNEGNIKTYWNTGNACPSKIASINASLISSSEGLIPNRGNSIIIINSSFNYKSAFNYFLTGSINISQTVYTRPRIDHTIQCSGC